MNRPTPLFWFLLSFSLGIFLKTQHQTKFLIASLLTLMIFLLLIKREFRPVFLGILVFLILGWMRVSGYSSLEKFEGKAVKVEGEVEKSSNYYSIILKTLTFKNHIYRVEGKVYLINPSTNTLTQGEILSLKGRLGKNTNGHFVLLNPAINKKNFSEYRQQLEKIKRQARLFFKKNLPPEEADFVVSSLFGRIEINSRLYRFFQKAGAAHLLAISGLHAGFLFFFLFSVLFFLPRFARYSLSSLFLLTYAALAGFTPSVVRASLMLLIGFIASEMGRTHQIINNLSLACFIILFLNPFLLHSLSFQLSALAVAGIGFLKPVLDEIVSIYPESLKNLINTTLSAQSGTLPLVLYTFRNFPLISLLSNILIIPLFSLAITIAFLALSLSFFAPFLTLPLMPFLFLLARIIITMTKTFSLLPSLNPLPTGVIFISVFLTSYLKTRLKQKPKLNLFWILSCYLLIFSFALWYYSINIYFRPPTLTFLNVGQGDACFIQLPQGQNLLIDGGASSSALLRNLDRLSVQKIDAIFLSLPHHDHIGGLSGLSDKLKIGELYSQPYPQSKEFKRLISKYRESKVKIHLIKSIATYRLTEGNLKFVPFYLEGDFNESPLTAIIKIGRFSFLFPGDAGYKSQSWLKNRIGRVTVLKLPHHGSFLLSEFLKRTKPKIGIISLEKNNQYGHPKKEVVSLLKRERVKVYRTDENGWIRIRKEGNRLTIISQFN